MKLIIDRGQNKLGVYKVIYCLEEDCPIAWVERNFSGRWSGEVEINLRIVSEIDKLITLELPSLKGTLLSIKHPLLVDNKDMMRLWFARMKYKRDEVEVIERGRRMFTFEDVIYHINQYLSLKGTV